MVSRRKQLDKEALADLAYQRLNLGRATWLVECFPSSGHVSVRTTDIRAGRRVDRGVAYRTHGGARAGVPGGRGRIRVGVAAEPGR